MTKLNDNDIKEIHKLYIKHLQNLEGDMVDSGYDTYDVVRVLVVFIHSMLHNKDLEDKIKIYNILLNHFFEFLDNLHKLKEKENKK